MYRDPYGVPHIEAETEAAAWYALGFEEARDALLLIQISAKRVRGEAVKYLSDPLPSTRSAHLLTDMLVQVLGTYPQNIPESQLRSTFAVAGVPTANFYDNCVAFAAGVNAYRELVRTASIQGSAELTLRNYLDGVMTSSGFVDMSWVYEEPVSPLDFLWYGRWTNAYLAANFARSKGARVNSYGPSYSYDDGTEGVAQDWSESELIGPPGLSESLKQVEDLKRLFAGLPGMGSNAFCWSKEYCEETANGLTVKYSGLMADPHDGNLSGTFTTTGSFVEQLLGLEPAGAHTWFAHVKVTPPGQTVATLDAFGTVPHGMATFFTAHNQNLAWGGTLGAPNWSDAFLLRLREDQNGEMMIEKFYDYYRDSDGSNGAQDSDWSWLASSTCSIQRASGPATLVPYWRAGPFGFILPDLEKAAAYLDNSANGLPPLPVVYGEFPATGRHWRMKQGEAKMRFWADPEPGNRDPMVVALRVPLDAAVDGQAFHGMFPRDAWEFAHQDSVVDVQLRLNEQAASYFVNFCCVDRTGAMVATTLGAVPKRATYTPAGTTPMAYGPVQVHSFPDLYNVYSGGIGPVPARMLDDKVFDWRYGSVDAQGYPVPGTLQYLDLHSNSAQASFKAKFDYHGVGVSFPGASQPASGSTSPAAWWVDNAGFAAMCNATPWHASRKIAIAAKFDVQDPRYGLFNNAFSDNPILQTVLDSGTTYQLSAFGWEGPDRNQLVIDTLTDIARKFSSDPAIRAQAKPPMTVAEARVFAVNPQLYVADEYATTPALASLPPAIRIQQEILVNAGSPGTSQGSNGWPMNEADREARFFHDLWGVLTNPQNANYAYWSGYRPPGAVNPNLSLKQYWIDNAYQDASASMPEARHIMWYDDPQSPVVRWIEMPAGFALMDFQWDQSALGAGDHVSYGGSGTSGFTHTNELQGLVNWLATWGGVPAGDKYKMDPGSSAAALYEMWRMSYGLERSWQPLNDGVPTAANAKSWSWLQYTAFPLEQLQSARQTWVPPAVSQAAFDALYHNAAVWEIRNGQNSSLTAENINALTRLFLELGGFFVDDAVNTNLGNPSRKMARYMLVKSRVEANANLVLRDEMLKTYPGTYPLTGNLARMTVPRRLIDAGRVMGGLSAIQSQSLSTYFGARSCDHYGVIRWPQGPFPNMAPCWGGTMRDVHWFQDPYQPGQLRFVHGGASNHPLLTLFPDDGGPPRSYFWAFPGVRLMDPGAPNFVSLMQDLASNNLVASYYPTGLYRTPTLYYTTHKYP